MTSGESGGHQIGEAAFERSSLHGCWEVTGSKKSWQLKGKYWVSSNPEE